MNGMTCDINFTMQNIIARIIPVFMVALLLAGCAHYPLNMTEEEWTRLSPQQQMDARERQARLDQERAIEMEKVRLEQARKEAEQTRLEEQQEIEAGMIAKYTGVCIGGSRCPGGEKEHIYSLGQFAYVDKIVFKAHDNIGKKHNATVDIFADRIPVAENVDIKQHGSDHTFFVGEITRNIIVKVHNDDEVKITELRIYGSPLKLDKPRIIIKQ
ncbi:hypothetical protein [Pseudodesulfovibrio sp. zrk46]|uniref:hypothetical protein n=1 Tax=Pseudodesulfovibrio sp. zrk46 TaxID=2725288 RepID=UPI001B38442C|nr:hypothetical protein [Pseudodesulfovibrio sp. zrk46]